MQIFIAYSHDDGSAKDKLVRQMSTLVREGTVVWSDSSIDAGSEWAPEIQVALSTSEVIILLLSDSFISSDFCHIEMGKALEREAAGNAIVIPIIYRDCDWESLPLARLNVLPRDGKAIYPRKRRDALFKEIVKEVRNVVHKLQTNYLTNLEEPPADHQNPRTLPPHAAHARNNAASSSLVNGDSIKGQFEEALKTLLDSERLRFFELAVFPTDVLIPIGTINRFWAWNGQLDLAATDQLCRRLQQHSLIAAFDQSRTSILLKKNIRNMIEEHEPDLPKFRQQLLSSHRPLSGRWSDLPSDEPYFWDYLTFHLKEAEALEELLSTISDGRFLFKKIRARSLHSIDADLLNADEIASTDSRVRLIRLIMRNFHDLILDMLLDAESADFNEPILELLNRFLDRRCSEGSKFCLTLQFDVPNVPAVPIRSCRFSTDGKVIISTSDDPDQTIRVWDTEKGALRNWLGRKRVWDSLHEVWRTTVESHSDAVTSCDFRANSKQVVSASADATLRVWDLEGAKETLKLHAPGPVSRCCVSPDGRFVLAACGDAGLKKWDLNHIEAPYQFLSSVKHIDCCAFGNKGGWIFSGSADSMISVWDTQSNEPLSSLQAKCVNIRDCSVDYSGEKMAAACEDGSLLIWPKLLGAHLPAIPAHANRINGCCFSEKGDLAVTASSDETVKLWDASTGEHKATFLLDGEMYCCAMYGDLIVAGGARGFYFLRLIRPSQIESTTTEVISMTEPRDARTEDLGASEKQGSAVTDPSGRVFISYRRSQLDQVRGMVAALNERGVPTWQDLYNLGMGQTETQLTKTLTDRMTSGALLWLTPDVLDSVMIRNVEMPAIMNRAYKEEVFFAAVVAAGGLEYSDLTVLGNGVVPYDLSGFNVGKVAEIAEPLDITTIAQRILRTRIEKIHTHLSPDAPLVINLYSWTPAAFETGKALIVDWRHHFRDGRNVVSGAWENSILPALKDVANAVQEHAPGRDLIATGQLSLPGAVALGTTFSETGQTRISWRPRQTPDQLWSIDGSRISTNLRVDLQPDSLTGDDLALLVSVDNNVMPGFTRSKPNLKTTFRAIGEIFPADLPPGVHRYEIRNPEEARSIAYLVRDAIMHARQKYPEIRRTHLFIAIPVGLAMMIGQLMNQRGPIQLYEYHADNFECPYQPSVLLNATW